MTSEKYGSIKKLTQEKNAIILAHNYQRPEVQDIADFVGDSLELARKATTTDADIIVFCGVDFMAETASILNPNKKVLMPDLGAICPMAQQLTIEDLVEAKKKYPDANVVLYINTLAIEKTYADCVCTSANAPKIVESMKSDSILFGPDHNLARYVEKNSSKKIITVPEYGLCPTHHQITYQDLLNAKKEHHSAKVVVHPECVAEIQELADHIASTSGMVRFCRESESSEFLIGTEMGLLHRLEKECPGKKLYPLSKSAVCPQMKMHTLDKILKSLEKEVFCVKVQKDIADKAIKPIERMLKL